MRYANLVTGLWSSIVDRSDIPDLQLEAWPAGADALQDCQCQCCFAQLSFHEQGSEVLLRAHPCTIALNPAGQFASGMTRLA